MTEKEIRDILRSVCTDLDRRVRVVVRDGVRKVVVPAALGAGLALGGCGDRAAQADGAAVVDGTTTDMRVDTGNSALYAAPQLDRGVVPPYMAPDIGVDISIDAGNSALYAAPQLDGGVVPPYMAPDARITPNDAGPQPLYMASSPVDEKEPQA